MGQFEHFATILENKIRKEILSEIHSEIDKNTKIEPPVHPSEDSSYLHLAWLMGHMPVAKSSIKNPYAGLKKPAKPRPSHHFNEDQKIAYALLKSYVPNFADNFSSKELKQAYRASVLKTHPDKGGSTREFWQVRQAHQSLAKLFQ